MTATTGPLPFAPEPIDVLRARYPAAIARIWDYRRLAKGEIPTGRPGLLRTHVLDSEDGLRLIISTEDIGHGPALHVSASPQPGSNLRRSLERREMGYQDFLLLAERRFREISGRKMPPLAFSSVGKGIPHWFEAPQEEVSLS